MSAPTPRRTAIARRPSAIEPPSPPLDSNDKASGNVPIDPEQIAALAYSYWEARRGQGGAPELDWLRAEQRLRVGG